MSWLDDLREDLAHGHRHRHHHHHSRLTLEITLLQKEVAGLRKDEHDERARMEAELRELTLLLGQLVVGMSATDVRLTEIIEGVNMPILPTNGVPLGGSTTFQASPIPEKGLLKPGTTWSFETGDTSVTLSPADDGDTTKIKASVALTETLPSFGLTVKGTGLDGTLINRTFVIPVQPSVGAVSATDVDLNQVSTAPPPPPVTPVASPASVSLAPGASQQLAITETSGDVTATSTYVSDNTAVATVDAGGNITGVANGSANVTVTDAAGNMVVVPVVVSDGSPTPQTARRVQ